LALPAAIGDPGLLLVADAEKFGVRQNQRQCLVVPIYGVGRCRLRDGCHSDRQDEVFHQFARVLLKSIAIIPTLSKLSVESRIK